MTVQDKRAIQGSPYQAIMRIKIELQHQLPVQALQSRLSSTQPFINIFCTLISDCRLTPPEGNYIFSFFLLPPKKNNNNKTTTDRIDHIKYSKARSCVKCPVDLRWWHFPYSEDFGGRFGDSISACSLFL